MTPVRRLGQHVGGGQDVQAFHGFRQFKLVGAQFQDISCAGYQLGGIERFLQKVGSAQIERFVQGFAGIIGGDDNHRRGLVFFVVEKALEKFRAIHFRHDVIQKDQVRLAGAAPFQRFQGVRKDNRFDEIKSLHQTLRQKGVWQTIVDDHNLHGQVHSLPEFFKT